MSKKESNDKYYTKPEIAEWCWSKVLSIFPEEAFIEPSAGSGNFLRKDVDILGYDLIPERDDIVQQDFFDSVVDETKVYVGNPPYGFASSLALRFINRAASAKGVCFVLPKTFKKELFQRKVDKHLHLVGQWDLPKESFTLKGASYDVPSCFQIWERRECKREVPDIVNYLVKGREDDYDITVRRVGGKAGMVIDNLPPHGNLYRVKCDPKLIPVLKELYPEIKECASNTAGVRSITLDEINLLLTRKLGGKQP